MVKVLQAELVCKSRAVFLESPSYFGLLFGREELCSRRVVMHHKEGSDGYRPLVFDPRRCTRQQLDSPTTIVRIPSRTKIHCQPERPPRPFISTIPRAKRPPKAPAAVAAEKKMAIRTPHSWRLYQSVMLVTSLLVVRSQIETLKVLRRDYLLVGDAWEETTLGKAKSHACSKKTFVVLDETHSRTANTPRDHDDGDPDRGTESLHGQIRGNLCCHVPVETVLRVRPWLIKADLGSTYKTLSAWLYCSEVLSMRRSSSNPARRAFPMLVRSRKESR